jgi:metal-responsive CopG/Arc/MetJ family transcriptional regulator
MRTLIDLPQEQIDALAKLGRERGSSRAALIREAVAEYLGRRQAGHLDEAFGLWRTQAGEPEDGVAYQDRLRAEWE